jgi:hypothetical protein
MARFSCFGSFSDNQKVAEWLPNDNQLTQATTPNRPALLEARQRAEGVLRGGLAADDSAIRQRLL